VFQYVVLRKLSIYWSCVTMVPCLRQTILLMPASIAPPHFTYHASSNLTCRDPADLLHMQLIRSGFIVRSLCAMAYSCLNDPDLPSLYCDMLVGCCAQPTHKNLVREWVAWNPLFPGICIGEIHCCAYIRLWVSSCWGVADINDMACLNWPGMQLLLPMSTAKHPKINKLSLHCCCK
jgi:hypothetical protein